MDLLKTGVTSPPLRAAAFSLKSVEVAEVAEVSEVDQLGINSLIDRLYQSLLFSGIITTNLPTDQPTYLSDSPYYIFLFSLSKK